MYQGSLANAGIARHEDELQSPALRLGQGHLESGQLGLASHKRRLQAHGGTRAPRLGTEAISLLPHGLNIFRCGSRIPQRLSDLPDADAQDTSRHMRPDPHVLHKLQVRNDTSGVLQQVLQHRQRFGS